MAEGLARHLFGTKVDVVSAGSEPTRVNPFAIEVMAEIGIDISEHASKSTSDLDLAGMDLIVTLCADEVCPIVPSKVRKVHWPFPDPAAQTKNAEEQRRDFRVVRDLIRGRLVESKRLLGVE